MFNFYNKKTQKVVARVIVGVIIVAMVLGAILPSFL